MGFPNSSIRSAGIVSGFPFAGSRDCLLPAFAACPGVCMELFEELTDMRADLTTQHLKVGWLLNLVKPASGFDGFGGFYIFDSTSSEADNGLSVIRTNAIAVTALGRYLKWL